MFSSSSVLPEDSLSKALRRGKQKEKAGADSGAISEEKDGTKKWEQSVNCLTLGSNASAAKKMSVFLFFSQFQSYIPGTKWNKILS